MATASKQHLLFNFEDLKQGERALKKVEQAFAHAGVAVIYRAIDEKLRRTAGVTYREVHLAFADAQQVTLKVKQSGDIWQVLVNSKVLPIRHQDNHEKGIAEIAAALEKGRAKFQQQLSRQKTELPKGVKSTITEKAQSLEQIRDSLKAQIQEVREKITAVKNETKRLLEQIPREFTAAQKDYAQYLQETGGNDYEAAKAYMKEQLQGRYVETVIGKVFLEGKTRHEMRRHMSIDPLKAQLVIHVPDILKNGDYLGKESLHKERTDNFISMHFFQKSVEVGALNVLAGVSVGEEEGGRKFVAYGLGHAFSAYWQKRIKKQETDKHSLEPQGNLSASLDSGKADVLRRIVAAFDGANLDDEGLGVVILRVIDRATGRELNPETLQPLDNEQPQNAPVEVTGRELGEYPDTPEGLKQLREAAFDYLKSLGDDKEASAVYCAALSAKVYFDTAGAKKYKSLGANPKKLKLAAKIREIIQGAQLVAKDKPSYVAAEKERGVTYSVLRHSAEIDGESVGVRLIIRKLQTGQFQYDLQIKESMEAILDSAERKSPKGRFGYKSDVPSGLLRPALAAGWTDDTTLDAASGGWVLNLFIEGEDEAAAPSEAERIGQELKSALPEIYKKMEEYVQDAKNSDKFSFREKMEILRKMQDLYASLDEKIILPVGRLHELNYYDQFMQENPRMAKIAERFDIVYEELREEIARMAKLENDELPDFYQKMLSDIKSFLISKEFKDAVEAAKKQKTAIVDMDLMRKNYPLIQSAVTTFYAKVDATMENLVDENGRNMPLGQKLAELIDNSYRELHELNDALYSFERYLPDEFNKLPVSLTGRELGEFEDTPEGLKQLRMAAKNHLQSLRGQWVECPALPRDENGNIQKVEIRQRGIKEFISHSGNPLKLKLVPKIVDIIKTAKDAVREDNYKKEKKSAALEYWRLKNEIDLSGNNIAVTVILEKDVRGIWHYDIMINKSQTKTALDAISAVLAKASIPNPKSGVALAGASVAQTLVLDAVSADFVLNLFIEGEDEAFAPVEDASAAADEGLSGLIRSNSQYYEYEPKKTIAKRKKDNNAALMLLDSIEKGELSPDNLSDEQKRILAKYSGTGGGLIGADGKKGSAYEYYTPKPIVEGMWNLLKDYGFNGGRVLDPCAGAGIFGAHAPKAAVIDAVELNATSGKINQLINDDAAHQTHVMPFEQFAAQSPDTFYDVVISNVPFGSVADRGENCFLDSVYQKEPIQNYFILRTLEKLKPRGLAIFITPPRCISGKGAAEETLRINASYMAEFVGAYRLPNSVFASANADTMTDIMLWRKYDEETAQKIAELKEQSPQILSEANVMWSPFISGQYFNDEGKKFVLGDFVPGDPNAFRKIDRVITDKPVAEIAKMLKKFPASRINWELLQTQETQSIGYNEGDFIVHGGNVFRLKNGKLEQERSDDQNTAAQIAQMLQKLSTPYAAFENKLTWAKAENFFKETSEKGLHHQLPLWFSSLVLNLRQDSCAGKIWAAGIAALSVEQVIAEQKEKGFKFLEEYKELSDAMQRYAVNAKKFSGVSYEKLSIAFKTMLIHYNKSSGFSGFWRGDVLQEMQYEQNTPDAAFDAACYEAQSSWIDIEKAKSIFGADFDPIVSDDWCISADGGKICRAEAYYTGNYQKFLNMMDGELSSAKDEVVLNKLLRQKEYAKTRINQIDIARIHLDIFSPYVSNEHKITFLREYVHHSAEITEGGQIKFNLSSREKKSDEMRLVSRIEHYLDHGTITLGNQKYDGDDVDVLARLKIKITALNESFNAWAKSDEALQQSIHQQVTNPNNIYFKKFSNASNLNIPGMNPQLKLHPYQCEYVRKTVYDFSGINGFGVGLGKTFTALAVAQQSQSMGVKKKTLFVVPNSTLSNWRKEASRAYSSMEGCLFVGLRETKQGGFRVNSKFYDEDLTTIQENRHNKIFMTAEAFERIKMRGETLDKYAQFMRLQDLSFAESESKKADEKAKHSLAGVLQSLKDKKTSAAPYLENLGIDSIIIDEAHTYKNSSQAIEYKSAKYLSLANPSKRGIDAQAKAWYIRSSSPKQDGVILLTATPITNSPLEVYSMLTLAVGHEKVNKLTGGLQGADHFLNVSCQKTTETMSLVDGLKDSMEVFQGLRNIDILRNAIEETATIKDAQDVGQEVIIPGRENHLVGVDLPKEIEDLLKTYAGAYRYASDIVYNKPNRGDPTAYKAISEHLRMDDPRLMGHPLSFLNRITDIVMDPEAHHGASFYLFHKDQLATAENVLEKFNDKKFKEKETRSDLKDEIRELFATIHDAKGDIMRISINTRSNEFQTKFEDMAEEAGLNLDVTIPPKLAAFLKNFQNEEANPKGIDASGMPTKLVKQIVFCDSLSAHNKIKRILVKHAGINPDAIAFITGRTNNEPEEIIEVQNGFNGFGEDNRYRVIIANEKAEVGINLQMGTQAVHHLTLGWTPDSVEQRNGRAARQGNKTQQVNVYFYEANGTFDVMKRQMLNSKSQWINELLHNKSLDTVKIEGGLSSEQMQALAASAGDTGNFEAQQGRIREAQKMERINAVQTRQRALLETMASTYRALGYNLTLDNAEMLFMRKHLMKIAEINGKRKGYRRELSPQYQEAYDVELAKVRKLFNLRHDGEGDFEDKLLRIGIDDLMRDNIGRYLSQFEIINEEEFKKFKQSLQKKVAIYEGMEAEFRKLSQEYGGVDFSVAEKLKKKRSVDQVLEFEKGHCLYKGAVFKINNTDEYIVHDGRDFYNHGLKKNIDLHEIKPIPKGDEEYERALEFFAKIEDEYASDQGSTVHNVPFSSALPAVLNYRKTKSRVMTHWKNVMFKHPGVFPYSSYHFDDSPELGLFKKIFAQQQEAVDWHGRLVVHEWGDPKIEVFDEEISTATAFGALIDYILNSDDKIPYKMFSYYLVDHLVDAMKERGLTKEDDLIHLTLELFEPLEEWQKNQIANAVNFYISH